MYTVAKKLLLQEEQTCKLTITTTPSNATCVITYEGVDYTAKSLDVKKGSTVTYTVSRTYYDTKTATVTINEDKNISVSLSATEYTFSRPNLSANGTLGSGTFAVQASSQTNGVWYAYYAVDSDTDGSGGYYWCTNPNSSWWYTLYYKYKLKITKLVVKSYVGFSYSFAIKTVSIQGSNNNSTWTNIPCSLSSASSNSQTIALTNTNYYKYYKLTGTSPSYAAIYNIAITGKYIRV